MPPEELTLRPMDVAFPVGPQPHLGPLLGKHEELFRVDPASRAAERSRTRWRKAPVAAWPASIHPPYAITIVVRLAGGSRSNSTWSMFILAQKLGLVANGVSCNSCVQQDLSWVCR